MTLLVQQLVSVGIILWGVYLVVDGQISVGALIAANILAGRALAPLSMIAQTIFRGQYARKSMAALDEVMALPTERPPSVRSHLRVRSGSIALKDVSFTYPEASRPALDSVSLEIAAGSRVALLGRVGSGKTTLGKLIAGLITPDHGTILVDRHGLAQYDPAELRDGIGYLPQTNQFFSGTLRENLLLGRPNAPQSDIEMALYVSGLDAVVSSNPQGLDIAIGDQGERLSGGQAQALSLARLLLRRPRLMFLDEPTNAMDQEMEGRVCSRLATEIGPEVGLVLCTHRQSLAAIADRYIVLDAGRVLLDGTREDVTARLMGQPSPETTGDL
jgi:ATP-binding cassette subfamily C protein LapB